MTLAKHQPRELWPALSESVTESETKLKKTLILGSNSVKTQKQKEFHGPNAPKHLAQKGRKIVRERYKVKVRNGALIHHARQTEESPLTVQNQMSTTTAVLRNVLSLLLSYVFVGCRCIGVHVVCVGCLGDISLCCSSGRWFVCCTLIMLIALILTSAAVLFIVVPFLCSVFWLIVRKVRALSASVCRCKRNLLSECNFPLAILIYFINNIFIYKYIWK